MSYVTYSVWDTPESSKLFRVFVAFTVLPIVAVIARFWSRTIVRHTRFGWDDWFCLLALILDIGLGVIGFWWLKHGLGHHIDTVPPQNIIGGLKALWAGYFVFNLSLGCVKTSALCLYSRIFTKQGKWFHRAIILGHVVLAAWYLCVVFETIFQCTPVAKAWNPTLEGHCIDSFALYLNTLIWDVCLDLYILVLPMPVLYRLQIRPKLKILATVAFVLGYSCIIASIGRLVAVVQVGEALNGDFFFASIPILVWVGVEAGVGIISICIPSWWQLYVRARKNGVVALFNRREYLTAVSPHELPHPERKSPVEVPAAAGADGLLHDLPRSSSQQRLNVFGSGTSRGPLLTSRSDQLSTSDEERGDSDGLGMSRYRTETSELRIV